MQSYLKTRPVLSQFFIFLSLVAAALLVFVGLIGTVVAMKATGLSLLEISDVAHWDLADARYLLFLRVMLAVQFIGLFLVPVLLFAYLSDAQPARYLGLKKTQWLYVGLGILLMFAALPLVEYLGALNQKASFPKGIESWMKSTEKQAQQQIAFLLKSRSPLNLFLNLILVAGFAAIGEELFFRGVLQRLFIKGFKNVWIGILLAAFCFSALHLQFYGFLPRFFLGILLGLIYQYSGSLWPAMAAHFFYDGLLITLAYFNPALVADENSSIIPAGTMLPLALASAAATAGLVYYFRRQAAAPAVLPLREPDEVNDRSPFDGF